MSTNTLLKVLLTQRHLQKYETFRAEYTKIALKVAPDDVPPSKAQYYRWLSGQLKGGVPYPDACRVLEGMFPPWTASDLFDSYRPDQRLSVENDGQLAGGLLDVVPYTLAAAALEGAWLTSYRFSDPPKHHADIAHIVALSERHVSVKNYPPAPRSEGRASPLRNDIAAQVANRHLIGHWKNSNDTRYFGSFHLAVLPGETVMEGYYTGFASDINVSAGPWKWVRLDRASFTPADLAAATLRGPVELYDLVSNHTRNDPPLTLADVREAA